MLVITGVFECAPDGIEAFKAAACEMMRETRQEPGCLTYEFSQSLEEDTRFRVYEEWRDEAAFGAHGATPHMARFRAALGAAGLVSRHVVKIEAGERTVLG